MNSEKSADLFKSVIDAALHSEPDVVEVLRKFHFAASMFDMREQIEWASLEMSGYGDVPVPWYRVTKVRTEWIPRSPTDAPTVNAAIMTGEWVRPPDSFTDIAVTVGAAALSRAAPRGLLDHTGKADRVRSLFSYADVVQQTVTQPESLARIVDAILQTAYERATEILAARGFGSTTESVFQRYQLVVEPVLSKLGLQDHFTTVTSNMTRGGAADLQAASLAARNILHALSDQLWQVPGKTYPLLNDSQGKPGIVVTADRQRNRLRAYLHQWKLKSDSLVQAQLSALTETLDALYGELSAGKAQVEEADVASAVFQTYAFVGEMTRHTDMEPITEIK